MAGLPPVVWAIVYNTAADPKVDSPTVSEEAMVQLRIAKRKPDEKEGADPGDGGKNREKNKRS